VVAEDEPDHEAIKLDEERQDPDPQDHKGRDPAFTQKIDHRCLQDE